jgi:SAM-dependent methyltransferase
VSRDENIERLSSTIALKSRRDFMTVYFITKELKYVIAKYAKGKLLDVGCGNKPYELLFSGIIESYIGCDVIQSDKQKVDVICEANYLKFNDNMFSSVFSTQVIEHVDATDTMLKEIHRVLEPGGVFILSGPFVWELHEEPYDFFRFTKYGFKAILERNNFELLELKPTGGKWAAITQMNLNIWYSAFMNGKGLFPKLFKVFFLHFGGTWLVNSLGLWMDRKWFDELLTLNYVVVARKRN